jgi:hypothetical protein
MVGKIVISRIITNSVIINGIIPLKIVPKEISLFMPLIMNKHIPTGGEILPKLITRMM